MKGADIVKGSAYVMVVLGILFAKCLGFLRDIVFASQFGASEYTDIYFQVFGIASLIFTGIGSALSTLVIKNLNKPENKSQNAQKDYFGNNYNVFPFRCTCKSSAPRSQ